MNIIFKCQGSQCLGYIIRLESMIKPVPTFNRSMALFPTYLTSGYTVRVTFSPCILSRRVTKLLTDREIAAMGGRLSCSHKALSTIKTVECKLFDTMSHQA
ncbi:hypothetical protein CIPAW_03G280000 [Carya illinoinensis]|uniref:Uncharacterized protein n=1 Tax=Carya illinoinensis TaxID=32201 RepID=A0A8T1R8K9_CARIL|nr:hypothetical protein CIPAW_03G280000 [Carya illinoinensis]